MGLPELFVGCSEATSMTAKAKVVITDYVWESLEVEKRTLEDIASLVALKTKKPEEFLPQAADCDALLNTYAGPITAEVMARMPRCRIIARYGIGVDTIDLEAATRAGSTLGLVGFGNIARQVAVRAAAFGMRVLFADPFVQEKQFDVPGKKTELHDLLRGADFVSLHPPLTQETRKMIDGDALARMKPTAFLVNCSRGPIIDTDALVRALDSRKIAGCALDTTDPEPLPESS